jgi:tRNA dimethylallyltransferase
MSLPAKTLIIIAGPTASGKTSIAIKLAQEFDTEIISCDSRQLYREMTIGTAKPSNNELSQVKHHFINSHSIHEEYDAGKYETDANLLLKTLFEKHEVVIMAGGTGLFIKAAIEGLDSLPQKSEAIRAKWQQILENTGIEPLQNHLKEIDPEKFSTMDQNNPQRLIRALEICELSGKKHTDIQTSEPKPRPYRCIQIALDLPRDLLYERINERVDAMVLAGLEGEVRGLSEHSQINALKTVGYNEFFDAFEGKHSIDDAIDKVKQHSRNYAKRQITWFKKMDNAWFSPFDYEAILSHVRVRLES